MWDEEQVEAAIDDAARQMTAGEPGAELRVRVVSRIENRQRVQSVWRPALAGLIVAALLVVAVMVRLKPDATHHPGPAPTPTTTVQSSPSSSGASEQVVRLPPPLLGVYGGQRKPDATYDMDLPSDVDAVTLPSIDLESIAVAALPAAESIQVEPLEAAAPIAVIPLSTENEGVPR